MEKKELAKRYILAIISLFFSALGVAFTKHGELGVSPISSVANVVSIKYTALTLGNWLIVWNCILILGQIIILRKKFQPIQLLQIPLSFLFGFFTDLCMKIVAPIPVDAYPVRLLMIIIGVVILAFGIALSVIANVIMNSGEAFVKAIADTTKERQVAVSDWIKQHAARHRDVTIKTQCLFFEKIADQVIPPIEKALAEYEASLKS